MCHARSTESDLRAVSAKRALELVENAVILVEVAELSTEMIMNVDRLHRSTIHVHIPDLEAQVITRQNVPPVSAELDVGNRRDNLRKERSVRGILFLLEF